MKFFRFPLFVLFVSFVVHSSPAEPVGQLPEPPMQGKPWTPPVTKLPKMVVDASGELFDQGMADPRGCEYREVEISNGREYEPDRKIHAWMLPGDGKPAYAIGWDGVIVPVTSVGPAVDLQKDFSPDTHGLGQFHTGWPINAYSGLSEKIPLPIKTALLLRLGEVGLAEGLWSDGYKGDAKMNKQDPYADMAQEWLDGFYCRAIAAHQQGSDSLALQMFRALLPLKKTVEEAAARHGIREEIDKPYLSEIRQLPELIADQERRAREHSYTPVLASGTPAAGPERVATLIRALELAKGVQEMTPGETSFHFEPIVNSLIQEGEPAVESLIDCLEEDPPRLTRTQYTSGTVIATGPVERVYEPAYVALCAILRFHPTVPLSPDSISSREMSLADRKALAAKFRAFWSKYKSMPLEERWYAVLQDDNAPPHDWFEAAVDIAQRTNDIGSFKPNLFSPWHMGYFKFDRPQNQEKMCGEPLRAKTRPSVSDLLIQRFNQMLPFARTANLVTAEIPGGPKADITYTNLSNLLCIFSDWDGKTRADDLKKMTVQLNAKFPKTKEIFASSDDTNSTLFKKRAAAGDPTVFKDYEAWLDSLLPKTSRGGYDMDGYEAMALPAMWEHPNDPAAQRISEKIFGDKNSKWLPASLEDHRSFSRLVNTPLIGFPAFREFIEKKLGDTSAMGTTRLEKNGELDTELNGRDDFPERKALPKMDFRICDYYAAALAEVREFPDFKLNWPQAQRDAALADCKTFLTRYGNDYQYSTEVHDPLTRITLPTLDHPATEDDVAQGRAIFALAGETRLTSLRKFPVEAERPGTKKGSSNMEEMNEDGKSRIVTRYETGGVVWQAEEVRIDGQWQRFYGFAGLHQLDKVPAGEIEFPPLGNSIPLTSQIDVMIDPVLGGKTLRPWGLFVTTEQDIPLPVIVKAYDHNGLDQNVPAAFVTPPNAVKALPPGITLGMSYSEKILPEALDPKPSPGTNFLNIALINASFDYGQWSEIPLRKEITVAPASSQSPLVGAASTLDLLQMDLHDYFDMSRIGTYRLQATFHTPGGADTKLPPLVFVVRGKNEMN